MKKQSRRDFLKRSTTGVVGASMAAPVIMNIPVTARGKTGTPAILGGEPVIKGRWPARWPLYNEKKLFENIHEVMYSHAWSRPSGHFVLDFELAFKKKFGVKYLVTTNSGSSAMDCALNGCQIGPGDEVLVPAYTFITGVTMVMNNYALPVLIDIDPETYQMDPATMEEKITEHTKAIMLCHYSGSSADMDAIMTLAQKYNLYVIEDACLHSQGEWRGQKLCTFGNANAVSHQQSKMLPIGEGGSVMGNDQEVMERAYSWHDYGRPIKSWDTHRHQSGSWPGIGLNYKMTEFHGAVGLANLDVWEEQNIRREKGGKYLDKVMPTIPGIRVQKHYEGTTRASYYYCLMHYDKEHFNNLPIDTFVKAVKAEGIPLTIDIWRSKGEEPFMEEALRSRAFTNLYSKGRLEWYRKTLSCPITEQICRETVRIFGHYLITSESTLDAIPEAVRKVQEHSAKLV